ncbi:hypothetical protein JCM8208_000137 [Rhodotorula glutinis]
MSPPTSTRRRTLLLVVALLACALHAVSAAPPVRLNKRAVSLPVTCRTGTFQGKILSRVEVWRGIPYAQPPVGDLRFERPQPAPLVDLDDPTFGFVRDATAFKPRCLQTSSKENAEDCLTLNIYRPQGTPASAKLPVAVYLFGGSFYSGGANGYSPSNMVMRSKALNVPIIVITLDYRLGVSGFAASPALRAAGLLNNGLADQRQALRWIHDNILYFGGDPDKVLLFGQSAGAISVSYQMLAFGGNLTELGVRGAIMESGAPGTSFALDHTSSFPAKKWLTEDAKNVIMLQKTGCTGAVDEIACLKSAMTTQILSAQSAIRSYGGFPYVPTIDGEYLPDVPSKLLLAGKFAQIPFISGSQLDEGTDFMASTAFTSLNLTTDTQLTAWIRAQTPDMSATDAATFLRLYPNVQSAGSPYGTGDIKFLWKLFKRSSSMFGDLAFEAPRRLFLRAANLLDAANQATAANGTLVESTITVTQSAVEDRPVNTTIIVAANETSVDAGSNSTATTTTTTTVIEGSFSGNITNTTVTLAPFEYKPLKVWSYQFSQRPTGGFDYLGASHGDEIPWVWPTSTSTEIGADNLRNSMTDSWIYFVNYLDPNGPSSTVVWPQYEQSNKTQMQFKLSQQSLIADTYRSSAIDFINSNQAIFGQ